MKKHGAVVLVCALWISAPRAEESPSLSLIFEAPGNSTEIARRAQMCIAKLLKNDAVQLNDAGTKSALGLASDQKQAATAAGSAMFVLSDIEGGAIIANHRVPFRSMMVAHVAQAKLTVLTKDGRFKVDTTDLTIAQLSTGYAANDGFRQIREGSPQYKAAVKEMAAAQEKVAQCIKAPGLADW